jgi:hypothetical protein
MAIDERNIIDIVSTKDGTVALSVADHLDWADESAHLERLQDKLNCYAEFINSGEFVDKFPQAADQRPLIKIHFVHPPTAAARDFLSKAASVIEAEGISFSYDTLPATRNA